MPVGYGEGDTAAPAWSNLVVEEDLEDALGWDMGTLDGQPLVAEDFVFGVQAYLRQGPQIFGWHGSIMLEQRCLLGGSAMVDGEAQGLLAPYA